MKSDGSTAAYYQLPEGATELQHLISFKNMDAQVGEAFRALYRFGESSHSDKLRDARKVIFYMQAEIDMLEKYGDRTGLSKEQFESFVNSMESPNETI